MNGRFNYQHSTFEPIQLMETYTTSLPTPLVKHIPPQDLTMTQWRHSPHIPP